MWFLSILGLFLCIFLLATYVAFHMHHHFFHGHKMLLGEGFIRIFCPWPILEDSYEYLLVLLDELDGRLIKLGEIFSQGF